MMRGLKVLSAALFVLLLASFASASLEILLRGPSDGTSTSNYNVEFRYGFSDIPDVANCSLVIDSEIVETRSTLISFDNNKISKTLEAGTYVWQITCFEKNGNLIKSPTKTVTVDVEVDTVEGYDTIYNNNGLRTYVVSISPGQGPLSLPPMLTSEDIRVKTKKTTYYLDLMRMGTNNGTPYVEMRDRPAYKVHRIYVGESQDYDFEEDGVTDLNVKLEKIERGVRASFTVSPFPEAEAQEETQAPEETETPVTPPVETAPEENEGSQEKPVVEAKPDNTNTTTGVTPKGRSYTWLIVLIVILFIIGVGFVIAKSIVKPANKHEQFTPKPKKESPEVHKPSKKDESFDVIKSAGGGKKR